MVFDYRNEYGRYKRYYTYLEPVFRNPKARAYFSLILSLLSMSVFGFFAIRPTLNTIISLNKKITDNRVINTALQQKINALSLAQTDYYNYQEDIPLAISAVPNEPDVTILLDQIEKLADEAKVTIKLYQNQSTPILQASAGGSLGVSRFSKTVTLESIFSSYQQPGKKQSAPPSISLKTHNYNFSLSVEGSYASLLYFAERLNYIPRLVTLERVVVSVRRDEKTTQEIPTMSISGYTYYLVHE